ncbi:hypothetical protein DL98DRAFT_609304 [Cadophora sp. DSE1049]|nr:hypothetical protein DL98DRAFT_609304 [Cadophora sp. DSE1049]
MNPRKPRGGGPGRGKWKLDRSVRRQNEQFEEDEDGNIIMADEQDNGSMLDYLQNQAPRQPAAPTTFSPPHPRPQPQAGSSQPQQHSQPQRQSQSQPASQFQTQWRLPPPPVVQPNIATLPPPNIPSRPKHRDPTDGKESKPDRRLLNTDETRWWNSHPSQHRTNPSSDKCWQCMKQREGTKCDLGDTGYPCSRCREKGWGAACRNGLPSKEWEVRMLERKRRGEALARGGPVVGPGESGREGGRGRPLMKRRRDEYEDDDGEEEDDDDDDDDVVVYQGTQSRLGPRLGPGPRPRPRQAQPNLGENFQPGFLNSGAGYPAPRIRIESAESVQQRMASTLKRMRGEDAEEDDDNDDEEGQNTSLPPRPKIRRLNPPNNQNAPPQNSRRSAIQNRGSKPPCERCRRLNLRCGAARPCFDCVRNREFCTDSRTTLAYNAAGPPPFNDAFATSPAPPLQPMFFAPARDDLGIYDASPPPRRAAPPAAPAQPMFFQPAGDDLGIYDASPPPRPLQPPRPHQSSPQYDPWAALQDDASNLDFENIPGAEDDDFRNDFLAQINETLPLDMGLDPNTNTNININPDINITPLHANQSDESYQDQVDRRLQELIVASQSWAVVENELPAGGGSGSGSGTALELGDDYFGDLGLVQGRNQQTAPGTRQQGSPQLTADYFERVNQGAAPGSSLNLDEFDDAEIFDYEAYLDDPATPVLDPDPHPNPNVEPEFQEALNRAEQKRKLKAYQEYRRTHPRQPTFSAPPPPPLPPAPAPRNLGIPSSMTTHMLTPRDAPPANANYSPFQPRRPQPPTPRGEPGSGPAHRLGPFATWSWDGSNTINGPNPWPFTKIPPTCQSHTGEGQLGIYANMEATGTCDEIARYQAFPDLAQFAIHIAGCEKCGENPVKDCEVNELAQRDHVMDPEPFQTCVDCYTTRRQRVPNLAVNLERRKAFLCGACAQVVRREDGRSLEARGECLCRGTVGRTWLCHGHGREVEGEWVAALADAEAALMGLGVQGRCVACANEAEDRESGVWSCLVCRDWVWSNPVEAAGAARVGR